MYVHALWSVLLATLSSEALLLGACIHMHPTHPTRVLHYFRPLNYICSGRCGGGHEWTGISVHV